MEGAPSATPIARAHTFPRPPPRGPRFSKAAGKPAAQQLLGPLIERVSGAPKPLSRPSPTGGPGGPALTGDGAPLFELRSLEGAERKAGGEGKNNDDFRPPLRQPPRCGVPPARRGRVRTAFIDLVITRDSLRLVLEFKRVSEGAGIFLEREGTPAPGEAEQPPAVQNRRVWEKKRIDHLFLPNCAAWF
jgi:hypothetical protein